MSESSADLKRVIACAIVERLRNPTRETRPRPTIAELEEMLNIDDTRPIEMLPDGQVTVELPTYADDLADCVLDAIAAWNRRSAEQGG